MTHSAIASLKWASLAALGFAALAAHPLAAQNQPGMRDRSPGVRDIATTPIQDLNLARDEIPAVLQRAAIATYDADGLDGCEAIGSAIAELDAALGPDLDVSADERDQISVGRMAKSAIGSLMPFRSIVREITGAADHQRQFEEAIFAGAVRRGYLKGLGQQRGCAYPARPAFANVQVTKAHRMAGEADTRMALAPEAGKAADGTVFISHPVVQGD